MIAQRETILAALKRERQHLLDLKQGRLNGLVERMRQNQSFRIALADYILTCNVNIQKLIDLLESVDEGRG